MIPKKLSFAVHTGLWEIERDRLRLIARNFELLKMNGDYSCLYNLFVYVNSIVVY